MGRIASVRQELRGYWIRPLTGQCGEKIWVDDGNTFKEVDRGEKNSHAKNRSAMCCYE